MANMEQPRACALFFPVRDQTRLATLDDATLVLVCAAAGQTAAAALAIAGGFGGAAAPKLMLLPPPGGAWMRVVERPVITLPAFCASDKCAHMNVAQRALQIMRAKESPTQIADAGLVGA